MRKATTADDLVQAHLLATLIKATTPLNVEAETGSSPEPRLLGATFIPSGSG